MSTAADHFAHGRPGIHPENGAAHELGERIGESYARGSAVVGTW